MEVCAVISFIVFVGSAAPSPVSNPTSTSTPAPVAALSTQQARQFFKTYLPNPPQPWPTKLPSRAEIPQGPAGDKIREGIAILETTSKKVGPNAPIVANRLGQNNLNCISCHPAGPSGLPGTRPGQLALVNVVNEYPKLDTKSWRIITLQDRIRGMLGGGKGKLTDDSAPMQAMVAYFQWLGKSNKPGARLQGSFLHELTPPPLAADPTRGKILYTARCMACHGPTGLGIKKPDFDQGGGYIVPPVAGDDTYDDGGHMYLVPLLARFIHGYMPPGATPQSPGMSAQESYDIAAYINTDLPRKAGSNKHLHYPNAAFRPSFVVLPNVHTPGTPAWKKAKYGPYKPSDMNDYR